MADAADPELSTILDEEATREVERRLEEIAADPEARRRYDRDGDGKLDEEERRLARRAVEMEVLRERQGEAGAADEEVGELLRGRYELVERLGAGGQGVTWRARDRQSPETGPESVVVKELSFSAVDDWKSWELFEREADTLRTLDHPDIPDYIDHFRLETGEASRFCLVQQFVAGQSLEAHLDEGRRFDGEAVRQFLADLLETLEYLHTLNPPVVHRDVKPSNIIRRPDDDYSLVDFGAVQRALPDTVGGSTVIGTSGYIPPEQLMGRARPPTDVYALGATAIHLLSHRHPNDIPVERMRLDFADYIDVEPRFVEFLERMVEPTIEDRFQGAAEALAALETLERGESLPARRDETSPAPSAADSQLEVLDHRFVSSGLTVNAGDDFEVELPGTRSTFHAIAWNIFAVAVGPPACCVGAWMGDNPGGSDSVGFMLFVAGMIWMAAIAVAQMAHRWSGRIRLVGDEFRLTKRLLGIDHQTYSGPVEELGTIMASTNGEGPAQQTYRYTLKFDTPDEWVDFKTKIRADDAEALVKRLNLEVDARSQGKSVYQLEAERRDGSDKQN